MQPRFFVHPWGNEVLRETAATWKRAIGSILAGVLTSLLVVFFIVLVIAGQLFILPESLIYEFRRRKSECTEFCNAPHHWEVHAGRIVCASNHGTGWFGKVGRMLYGTPAALASSGTERSRRTTDSHGDRTKHSPTATPNLSSRHPFVAGPNRALPSNGQHYTSKISITRRHEGGKRLDVDTLGHKGGSAKITFS
jgi:hypothetical protein